MKIALVWKCEQRKSTQKTKEKKNRKTNLFSLIKKNVALNKREKQCRKKKRSKKINKGSWERTKQSKCDARVPATDGMGDI